MQPDKPQLAFFWLSALIAGWTGSDLRVLGRHCLVLLSYVWFYTFIQYKLCQELRVSFLIFLLFYKNTIAVQVSQLIHPHQHWIMYLHHQEGFR